MNRTIYNEDHEAFRQSYRSWVDNEIVPHDDEWNKAEITPRSLFTNAGNHGFLGFDIPEEFGGGGVEDLG